MFQLHKNTVLFIFTAGILGRSVAVTQAASHVEQTPDKLQFYLDFFNKLSQWVGEGMSVIPGLGFLPSIGSIWGVGAVIFVFLTVFSGISWLIFSRISARRDVRQALAKIDRIQDELDGVTTILTSDVSLLFVWDKQETANPKVFGALPPEFDTPGMGENRADLSSWLDFDSSYNLGEKISALRVSGKPFNVIVTTKTGKQLEADGCVAGGQATLRLKVLPERQIKQAQQEEELTRLRMDAEMFTALLDAVPLPLWLRNRQGRLKWTNHAYTTAVKGEDLAQVLSQQLELLSPTQRQLASSIIKDGGQFKDKCTLEREGQELLYDVSESILDDGSMGLAVEYSELKTLHDQIQTARDTRNHLLDNMSIGVAQFGADQKLIYANEAYSRLWGIDAEFLLTGPSDGSILDRLRNDRCLEERVDYRAWRTNWLKIYEKGGRHESMWHLPDGRSIMVTADCQKSGGVTYFYEDRTEKLKLESRYNEMISVQRETLDNLQEAAALFTSDGKLKLFNPAYTRIWNLSPELLDANPHIDDVIGWCRASHNDELVWKELKLAVTGVGEQRRSLQGRLERDDKTIVDFTTVPLPDGATLLIYDDITNTAAVERMLTERNEALMAADKLKSEFISHVSYQLRTPLTTIIGFSESLAMGIAGELSEKQRGYADDIRTSSDELLALIDDILDLATIDAGAMRLNIDDVDVNAIMLSVARIIKDQVNAAGARFQISIPGDIGTFRGDEKRVKQMLFNLLSNSLAFTTHGGTISLKARRLDNSMEFTVTDTGRGIEPTEQARIFDRFETEGSTSTSRGAGLGLSIVKSFVELHGGSIKLESIPQRGTRITCTLPLIPPREAEDSAAQA